MSQKIELLIERKSQLEDLLENESEVLSQQLQVKMKQKIAKLDKLINLATDLQQQESTLKVQYLTLIKERNVYFDKLRRIEVVGEENEWKGPCLRGVYNHLIDLRQ